MRKKLIYLKGIKSVRFGIIINTFLGIFKVIIGVLGNSYALIADGIESATDVFSSLIILKGLHLSNKEADEQYHYGYGKAEPLSALVVSILIIGAAIILLIVSIKEILTPHHLPETYTLLVLIVVIAIKEYLYRKVNEVGNSTQSLAVKSDALHHRIDSLTSIAALIGITIALIGGTGWESADDYAAIICSGFIFWNGYTLFKNSINELMDIAPDEELLNKIINITTKLEGVELVEKLQVRKSGLFYLVAMHVHADPNLSLHDAHVISGKIKSAIFKELPLIKEVLIHMEPKENN